MHISRGVSSSRINNCSACLGHALDQVVNYLPWRTVPYSVLCLKWNSKVICISIVWTVYFRWVASLHSLTILWPVCQWLTYCCHCEIAAIAAKWVLLQGQYTYICNYSVELVTCCRSSTASRVFLCTLKTCAGIIDTRHRSCSFSHSVIARWWGRALVTLIQSLLWQSGSWYVLLQLWKLSGQRSTSI